MFRAGQVSSINEVTQVADKLESLTKALVNGANLVMLGLILAGQPETSGKTIFVYGFEKYKSYRAMESNGATKKGSKPSVSIVKLIPKGIEGFIKLKRPLDKLFVQIIDIIKNYLGILMLKVYLKLMKKRGYSNYICRIQNLKFTYAW